MTSMVVVSVVVVVARWLTFEADGLGGYCGCAVSGVPLYGSVLAVELGVEFGEGHGEVEPVRCVLATVVSSFSTTNVRVAVSGNALVEF